MEIEGKNTFFIFRATFDSIRILALGINVSVQAFILCLIFFVFTVMISLLCQMEILFIETAELECNIQHWLALR